LARTPIHPPRAPLVGCSRPLVAAQICLLLSGCVAGSGSVDPSAPPGWELVWADEFDYTGLPDSTRWTYEVGMIRNRELQYYTRARRENARVEDGTLIIESRRERYDTAAYTSASLTTEGRASWRYGRIEVRAKLPGGRGMWPAIWMLGTSHRQVGWPATGEIDIMESVGFAPDTLYANVHTAAFNHVRGNGKGTSVHLPGMHTDYHVYAVEWFPDRIDFYHDGRKYFTFANSGRGVDEWPFDADQYLILNAAVGGAWGGMRGVDDAIFPQRYYVDYVRVYRRTPG
jgi:beta-glucanase (GH16 family)